MQVLYEWLFCLFLDLRLDKLCRSFSFSFFAPAVYSFALYLSSLYPLTYPFIFS